MCVPQVNCSHNTQDQPYGCPPPQHLPTPSQDLSGRENNREATLSNKVHHGPFNLTVPSDAVIIKKKHPVAFNSCPERPNASQGLVMSFAWPIQSTKRRLIARGINHSMQLCCLFLLRMWNRWSPDRTTPN
ncbi:hypothetical protein FKM82_020709 [Ascaphus truei]